MKGRRGTKLGRIRREQVLLVALWAGWIILYIVGYQAQWQESAKTQAKLPPLYKRIGEYGDRIAQSPDPSKESGELSKRLAKLQERKLGADALPRAIQQLAQAAGETGVTLEAINPRDDLSASGAKLPEGVGKKIIEVRLHCDSQALGSFLGKVAAEGNQFVVEQMLIKTDPKDPAAPITVELLFGTYGLV